MTNDKKWIRWNTDQGIIESNFGRMILLADGFVRNFLDEFKKTGGESLEQIILKDMALSMKINVGDAKDLSWESFEELLENNLTPFEDVENKPPEFIWDGKSRKFKFQEKLMMKLWPLNTIRAFKTSAAKALTEKGSNAIIGQASRKAGRELGDTIGEAFDWNTSDKIFSTIGNIMTYQYLSLGWGKVKIFTSIEENILLFLIENMYEAEVGGNGNQLTIIRNQFEGVGDSIAKKLGLSVRSKEVDSPLGNDSHVMVLKILEPNEEIDWKNLPWQKMLK